MRWARALLQTSLLPPMQRHSARIPCQHKRTLHPGFSPPSHCQFGICRGMSFQHRIGARIAARHSHRCHSEGISTARCSSRLSNAQLSRGQGHDGRLENAHYNSGVPGKSEPSRVKPRGPRSPLLDLGPRLFFKCLRSEPE